MCKLRLTLRMQRRPRSEFLMVAKHLTYEKILDHLLPRVRFAEEPPYLDVVIIAGRFKEKALSAALKCNIGNVWITDDRTAKQLLEKN